MKHILLSFSILFGLAAVVCLPGCSEMQGSNTAAVAQPTGFEAPQLLPRTVGLGSVDERVAAAQHYDAQIARLRQNPDDAGARLELAALFMQEARITGEHPYYYPEALKLLAPLADRTDLDPEQQFRSQYLTASVLLSQHEFAQALEAGKKAQAIFPYNAGIYGVLIDANVELGNYDEAVRLSDQMVSLRPDLRSYSRVSFLRELHGDPAGAIEAMEMAVQAGMPGYEQTAWCRLTLAELHENYGDLQAAKMHYHLILEERPEYPFAYAGLASVAEKEGDLDQALELLDKAIGLIPEVGFYEQKALLLAKMGREDESRALLPEILAMIAEDQEGGHIMDLELAAVQLELGANAEAALKAAQRAEQARPDNLEVQKMLALVYHQLGDQARSKELLQAATRTGWQDPELKSLRLELEG